MFQVLCEKCNQLREVPNKQKWMEGEQPYVRDCKSCCQKGKIKTDEHKKKLSESAIKAQTPELLAKKSEYRKAHLELWVNNLKQGGSPMAGKSHSEETKKNISEAKTGQIYKGEKQ